MAKELLLYDYIYSWSAESLINQMNDAGNKDITIRVNSGGGSVFDGWGLIAKIKESKNLTIKVDGIAASMAAMLLTYSDNVEALNVSRFMIHKASNGSSQEESDLLKEINEDLRDALNAKVNSDKLKVLKGYTIDELFDNTAVIDLWLNAEEALSVGLIDKINKLDEKSPTAFHNYFSNFTASNQQVPKPQILKSMNISQLKSEHPSVYAEVLALGVAQENDRVSAYLVFNDLDPVAVKEAIASGKTITATMQAEFMRKQFQAETLTNITAASAQSVTQTPVTAPTASTETESDKFYNEWLSNRKK